jgi:hypothetical protein
MGEAHSLIRLFFVKMKPEFFDLTPAEQSAFMARDRANLDALGMRAIAMVDCRGNDDGWEYVGVESWPSEEALKERERFEAEELKIYRYIQYKTHVGIGQSFEHYGKKGQA